MEKIFQDSKQSFNSEKYPRIANTETPSFVY